MEVEIISKECIKPSSSTPHHLKYHKLSLLDQSLHPMYIPLVLYYPMDRNTKLSSIDNIDHITSTKMHLLKHSLSNTLARFYPLAGKVQDNLSINCNDNGIYFIQARSKNRLNEFLKQPNLSLIMRLLPIDMDCGDDRAFAGSHVAKLQVTTFACGGIVIASFVSHKINDGMTMSSFLKSWAAVACKKSTEEAICNPDYNVVSSLFPQNDAYPREATWEARTTPFLKTGVCATRRFVFDASAIATLKSKATSSGVQNPTRVEVVTALLSKCIIDAFKAKSGSHNPTLLTHAVNLRQRGTLSFAENYMGNLIWMAAALCTDGETELGGFVSQLREAIRKLNDDFVKSLQGDEGFINFCEVIKQESEYYSCAKERITYTSWCKFGLYDIDFGWGKPVWASIAGTLNFPIVFANNVILMDTRLGDGIEAWVYLHEEDMAILELDREILAFATLDPTPFN